MRLKASDYEQMKFNIFKSVYEIDNNVERTKYIDSLCKNLSLRFLPTMYKADIMRIVDLDTSRIKAENARIVYELYPNLLNKMKALALELNLHSSLELSMLCEFLMKEGYLSKNQELKLQPDGRMCARGLLFVDIINGLGVCSNLSVIERDFLRFCGYNASVIYNYIPSNVVCFYETDEYKRNFNPNGVLSKRSIGELINYGLFRKFNHMFTIIEEQDKLYAYDAANTIILELPNPTTAQIITGYGTCRMQPYASIHENNGLDEIQAIIKLFERTDMTSPYSNTDFCQTLLKMNDLVLANQQLIDDFYNDAKSCIEDIAQESTKINVKRKYNIAK